MLDIDVKLRATLRTLRLKMTMTSREVEVEDGIVAEFQVESISN